MYMHHLSPPPSASAEMIQALVASRPWLRGGSPRFLLLAFKLKLRTCKCTSIFGISYPMIHSPVPGSPRIGFPKSICSCLCMWLWLWSQFNVRRTMPPLVRLSILSERNLPLIHSLSTSKSPLLLILTLGMKFHLSLRTTSGLKFHRHLMRQRGPLRQDVEEMLWESCYNRFKSGEISADSFIGSMAKLALTEVKQTQKLTSQVCWHVVDPTFSSLIFFFRAIAWVHNPSKINFVSPLSRSKGLLNGEPDWKLDKLAVRCCPVIRSSISSPNTV
jgi:hypothetical protein